ncbi:hypothetical protein DPM13_15770 [Paracoccus mutanolyticus]|uniref:Uncharacterized protein n=1 Tax=Paracoccus mutanolyticus TaxID=1499308 RepID=A0ABM6WT93_9RHOB|nr:hypothetical protein DPM13_15770 [Paracoccus mutanolyticus]
MPGRAAPIRLSFRETVGSVTGGPTGPRDELPTAPRKQPHGSSAIRPEGCPQFRLADQTAQFFGHYQSGKKSAVSVQRGSGSRGHV